VNGIADNCESLFFISLPALFGMGGFSVFAVYFLRTTQYTEKLSTGGLVVWAWTAEHQQP
jgi:hypothetical protein